MTIYPYNQFSREKWLSRKDNQISDSEHLLQKIRSLVDDSIRPELESDGVAIEVVGMDDDRIVQIRLSGSCQGCSSSMMAVTFDVERRLRAAVPEVRFVEAVL